GRRRGHVDQRAERGFLVMARQRAAVPLEERLGNAVGFQAAARPAAAAPAALHGGGVGPLTGAGRGTLMGGPVRDDARANAGADQADDRVLGAASRAEP